MLEVVNMLPPTIPVSGSMVWVRVFDEDDQQAAQIAANQIADNRLLHYYDPKQRVAREMAALLGSSGGYAWDTYLAFSPGVTWSDAPPQPSDWVHQLDYAAWAPAERRYKGRALVSAIRRMIDSA